MPRKKGIRLQKGDPARVSAPGVQESRFKVCVINGVWSSWVHSRKLIKRTKGAGQTLPKGEGDPGGEGRGKVWAGPY